MRRNDPTRPDIGPDRPALVWAGKSVNSVLPSVQIEPSESQGLWLIRVMLPTEYNSYSWHEYETNSANLVSDLEEYRADPEEFFIHRLGWTYNASKKYEQTGITLEDLGL